MEKEIHINSHIFSRNLEAKLADQKYLIFNLLTLKNDPVFEIVDTNSDVMKNFCKRHGTKFNISNQRIIDVNGKFNLMFD